MEPWPAQKPRRKRFSSMAGLCYLVFYSSLLLAADRSGELGYGMFCVVYDFGCPLAGAWIVGDIVVNLFLDPTGKRYNPCSRLHLLLYLYLLLAIWEYNAARAYAGFVSEARGATSWFDLPRILLLHAPLVLSISICHTWVAGFFRNRR